MNIVYTFDDNFVPQVAAGIASVCKNNADFNDIHFFLVAYQVTDQNKQKLYAMLSRYSRKISIIDLENIKEYFSFEFDTTGWKPIVLARLVLDKLLPEEVERVLYLDGDTIVCDSLKELWNVDLQGNTVAMSVEATVEKSRVSILNMEQHLYCNAGVILIDLKCWRDRNAGKRVLEFYEQHNGRLFANDQDALNGALKEEILRLTPRWNYVNSYYYYPYRVLKQNVSPRKYFPKDKYEDAIKHPAIIHYLGEERPWRAGNTHRYKTEYKKYLAMTPWADISDETGWELYFICWRVFNLFIKPFPTLRLAIINSLIPCFLKYRTKKIRI